MELAFDESYYPVAPAAQEADPATAMRDLLFRLSKAESGLQESELQHGVDVREVMIGVIELADRVIEAVEKADASSDPRELAVLNSMIAFGRALREMLDRHQVEAIATIGLPLDERVAEVASYETQPSLPANTVLRERRLGYRWPSGVLRKAQVVVSRGGGA